MKVADILIYEDEDIIALNKPAGLLSIAGREAKEDSLKTILREKNGDIFTVHRLDRDTSGIIVFARNAAAHRHFSLQFQERQTVKIYLGLLIGSLPKKEGTVDAPIAENKWKPGTMLIHKRGKPAITDYKVLQDFGLYTYTQFRIHTGRTHQIRVHAKEISHPLACDALYGDGKPVLLSSFKHKFKLSKDADEKPLLDRLALHAFQLQLKDMHGNLLKLEAPLHKDFTATLQQLQKWHSKK